MIPPRPRVAGRGDWPEAIRSFREQLAFFAPVRMDGMWVGRLAWAEFIAGEQETARQRLDKFIASTDPARTSMALPWAVRAVIGPGQRRIRAGRRTGPAGRRRRRRADPVLRASQEALGPDRFRLAWSQGQDMTATAAVGYVTRGRGPRSRPAQGWPSLTPTELTVAAAVAEGLSNPQIAARMFISRRTVTTHLTSVFRKLGISGPDRARRPRGPP